MPRQCLNAVRYKQKIYPFRLLQCIAGEFDERRRPSLTTTIRRREDTFERKREFNGLKLRLMQQRIHSLTRTPLEENLICSFYALFPNIKLT